MVVQAPQRVSEIVGRNSFYASHLHRAYLSVDKSTPDYGFWDLLRRCKQSGYEFSALFTEAISEITRDWVMGKSIEVLLADDSDEPLDPKDQNDNRNYTNDLLKRLLNRSHAMLLSMVNDLYGLGNQYVILNMDGSFSVPSPDTVDAEYELLDYRTLVKVTVTTRLERATITDTYTEEARYLKIKTFAWKETKPTGEVIDHPAEDYPVVIYPNLIGKIPVVHFANDRSGNETHGRVLFEPLLPVLSRYNDLLDTTMSGAELVGNPFLAFEGMKDVQAAKEANMEPEGDMVTDDHGNTTEYRRIQMGENTVLWVPEGGSVKLVSPTVGFTKDIVDLLKVLFLLILERTRIPQVVWGDELGQARASSIEQMETFFMYIWGRRTALEGEGADTKLGVEARGGILELVDIWLRIRSLTDPRIVVAPCAVRWADLGKANSELRLKWAEFLDKRGYITPQTAVRAAEIVDDPEAEVEKAEELNSAQADEFDKAVQAELDAMNNDLQDSANGENVTEDDALPEAA